MFFHRDSDPAVYPPVSQPNLFGDKTLFTLCCSCFSSSHQALAKQNLYVEIKVTEEIIFSSCRNLKSNSSAQTPKSTVYTFVLFFFAFPILPDSTQLRTLLWLWESQERNHTGSHFTTKSLNFHSHTQEIIILTDLPRQHYWKCFYTSLHQETIKHHLFLFFFLPFSQASSPAIGRTSALKYKESD